MSFKDMVEADNKRVFLNSDEFASNHNVVYDGNTYFQIPVLLTKLKESDRPVITGDHAEGLYLVSEVAHISLSDMEGVVPEKGQRIQIDDGTALGQPFYRSFTVVSSGCEMGMIVLELEAIDE